MRERGKSQGRGEFLTFLIFCFAVSKACLSVTIHSLPFPRVSVIIHFAVGVI